MKNGLLIINFILLAAVAVLFYLHFSSKKTSVVTDKSVTARDSVTSQVSDGFRIAYFDMDSVENNYQMVKDVKALLNKKEDSINTVLARLDKAYRDIEGQYQAKWPTLTPAQMDQARNDLKDRQTTFDAKKKENDEEYKEYYMHRMQDIRKKIEDYLKIYNKTKGYAYILSSDPGLLYYKDSSYNITSDLVRGLNDGYKKK
jgi:outer membrane protein